MDIDTEKDAEADKDWEQQLRAIEEADKKEAGLYTLPAGINLYLLMYILSLISLAHHRT